MSLTVSVVLSTYNQPFHLERVLWGYARQSLRDFELVVADDGSGPETKAVITRLSNDAGLQLKHVWHEDRGFRKNEILNRAIVATSGEYVIFSDGDCIPREDFVRAHMIHASDGCFLSGGAVYLPRPLTDQISVEDVRNGRVMDPKWLIHRGWRPGRRRLRLIRSPRLATLCDLLTPTKATWNGNNASTYRRHLIAVNGYDMGVGYGGEDRMLGRRLQNLGLRGKSVRHRAALLHLDHPRPYRQRAIINENRRIGKRLTQTGEVRARCGIAELQ